MVYRVGKMILQKTQDIFQGKVNDVYVCQDMAGEGLVYYTVLMIHDREIAKKVMELFHKRDKQAKNKFIADFTWKESYMVVFDHVRERRLDKFFTSEIASINECEQLCLNLTVECLASGMPYPLLYLQLKQGEIHISKDKSVYLGYCIDLEGFDETVGERECATLCAQKVFSLIAEINSGRATSYKLLEKKTLKSGYQRFTDLYKDLKMAMQPLKKEGIFTKIKKFFKYNQDRIFHLLMVVCILLGLLALMMVISQIFFSDVPFLRLFINTFKVIGTESLLQ